MGETALDRSPAVESAPILPPSLAPEARWWAVTDRCAPRASPRRVPLRIPHWALVRPLRRAQDFTFLISSVRMGTTLNRSPTMP